MKVLHILAQLPERTGSGVYFTNVIKGLKNYSDLEQACIYAKDINYQEINILEKNNQYEVVFNTEKLPFNIAGMSDVMPYPNTVYSSMTSSMISAWQQAFLEQLNLARKNFNPDIIITHHLWMLSSLVTEVFYDKKIIGVCHNTDIRQAEKNPTLKEKYVTNLHKLDKIISLSNDQIKEIEKVYNYDRKNIINLGAGFSEKIFYPLEHYPKKEKVELLYAGKFDDSKGFYELIKAFKILEKKYNNITLDLIGNLTDENKERIFSLIDNSKNITIYNTKNQKHLADIMREKDIFILPSYFEGLGLIAVEALGSGVRSVTTEIAGLMELLGDEINKSGVIEYVKMPTIYDTDKAVEEEKPAFVARLAEKISLQIERTKQNRPLDKNILNEILKHSWQEKIKKLYNIIIKL